MRDEQSAGRVAGQDAEGCRAIGGLHDDTSSWVMKRRNASAPPAVGCRNATLSEEDGRRIRALSAVGGGVRSHVRSVLSTPTTIIAGARPIADRKRVSPLTWRK